jgi:AbrB family looped-hinge helix DNA binding protein
LSTAKISSKGWIVIPSEFRKKYRLESGGEVQVVDYGGVLSLVPVMSDPVEEGMGALAPGRSLVKALLAERRREKRSDKKAK